MRRRCLCLAFAALPLAGRGAEGLQLRGRGVLRVFGLEIYEARLWTGSGWDPAAYVRAPFALELAYRRALVGARIVQRSLDEMRRQEPLGDDREARWREQLARAIPDVASGDRLTGHHDGDGGVRFEHNGRATAAWRDADFARLFFGIWLSPQTSEPGLRDQLLGRAG